MRKILELGLLTVLLTTFISFPAYAEEDSSDDLETEMGVEVEVEGDDSDEDEDGDDDDKEEEEMEDIIEDVFEEEGDEVEGEEGSETTVVSEEVDEDDLSEDMEEELEEATESGDYPDKLYLSVQWGYFPADGEEISLTEETIWDGSVNFGTDDGEALVAKPYKLLRFEKESDFIDFDSTSANQTVFSSVIAGHNDGILFKVKADLDDREGSKIWFETDYTDGNFSAYLQDLYEDGGAEFTAGDYRVVMKVWTHESWLDEIEEHRGEKGKSNHKDVEQGSWYEQYKNFSVENGFFEGYKGEDGKLNGKIGPGDSLTRFQLLKVIYELSAKLEMGVATSACDPDAVALDDSTVWMGEEHWARGYVECIEQSGLSITLLESAIAESQTKGEMPAFRIEVIATAFEMLDLDTTGTEDSDLSDVHDGETAAAFADMIDAAVELGVIEGYPDGSFKPMRTVNRAEMFKIVTLFYEILSL